MKVGDIVHYVEVAEGVAKRIPAIVVALYDDVHGKVVADLHKLEATVTSVRTEEDATDPDTGKTASHVDPSTDEPTGVVPEPEPDVPDAAVSGSEATYAAMNPQDQAEFQAWLASRGSADGGVTATATASAPAGDGAPSV